MPCGTRFVTLATVWAVAVSVGLAFWLASSGGASGIAVGILVAPCAAALLVHVRPHGVLALSVSLLLLTTAVVLLLIGFTGLLYLPSWAIVLVLLVGELRKRWLSRGTGLRGSERDQRV